MRPLLLLCCLAMGCREIASQPPPVVVDPTATLRGMIAVFLDDVHPRGYDVAWRDKRWGEIEDEVQRLRVAGTMPQPLRRAVTVLKSHVMLLQLGAANGPDGQVDFEKLKQLEIDFRTAFEQELARP